MEFSRHDAHARSHPQHSYRIGLAKHEGASPPANGRELASADGHVHARAGAVAEQLGDLPGGEVGLPEVLCAQGVRARPRHGIRVGFWAAFGMCLVWHWSPNSKRRSARRLL